MKNIVNVREAALLIGRSKATIYRWVKTMPHLIGVDGQIYIDTGVLMEYESGKRPGRPRKENNV